MYEVTVTRGLLRLEATLLKNYPFITHGFLGREGGVSEGAYRSLNVSSTCGDDPHRVRENRAIIARTCGFPAGEWVAMRQVHGAHVAPVCHPTDGELEADAVMTERPDLVLTVATADCVPILLCDPLRPAVAAIHAGWRGTATHIVGRTITAMEQAYGTKRDQIVAVIGPAIESCCYSVDEDVSRHFEEWEGRGLWREGRRIRLSLPRIVRGQLLVAGIRNEHIVLVDRCVSCEEERFFSHRRDRGQTGRQWNFIMIHR